MSLRLRSTLILGLSLTLAACAPRELQPPAERSTAIVGMAAERGRQLVDSVFWYTGVEPDSVIADAGMLRLVLPAHALGRDIRMDAAGCGDRDPGQGALRSLAAHAWAARDSTIVRDTVSVVFGAATVSIRSANIWGSRSHSCSGGPVTYHIAVADLLPTKRREAAR